MNYLLIANPASGSFIGREKIALLLQYLNKNNINADLYLSEYKNSIINHCLKYKDKYDTIIVSGGDGTINETIQLAKYKSFNLGIIPAGTANVLAKEFNISEKNIFKAADLIIKGNIKPIDTWLANDRVFLLMLSAGIDSAALENLNHKLKKHTGKFAYVYQTLKELIFSEKKIYSIKFDNTSIETKQFLLMNISKYAGNYKIKRNGGYTSGQLELIYFETFSVFKFLKFASHLFFNLNTSRLNFIKRYSADTFEILTCNALDNAPVQFDGDAGLYSPLKIKFNNTINIFA